MVVVPQMAAAFCCLRFGRFPTLQCAPNLANRITTTTQKKHSHKEKVQTTKYQAHIVFAIFIVRPTIKWDL